MTTKVIIKSSNPNHQAIKVEAMRPGPAGEMNGYGVEVLGYGEETDRFYVHSDSVLRISEVPLDQVPAKVREYTVAEKMAGVPFNPGNRADVANCKAEFAAVLERLLRLRDQATDPEVKRMTSIAITEAQTAQMWAVKALTWQA